MVKGNDFGSRWLQPWHKHLQRSMTFRLLLNFPMLRFPQLNDGNISDWLTGLFGKVKSDTLWTMLTLGLGTDKNNRWVLTVSFFLFIFKYSPTRRDIFPSVQFSRSFVSNSLRSHGLQHASLPCPSPSSGAYSNSCPLHQWGHPTISFCVISFSSCFQSFSASRSFPMNQYFASGGQSIGVSASVFPVNIQDWFPLGLTGLILQSKGLSRVFSSTLVLKHQFFSTQLSLWFNSHICIWLLEKP